MQPGEFLSHIAERLRPAGSVTREQVMVALFNTNPQAFSAGNLNHLRAGAVLHVPVPEAMAVLDRRKAARQVLVAAVLGLPGGFGDDARYSPRSGFRLAIERRSRSAHHRSL